MSAAHVDTHVSLSDKEADRVKADPATSTIDGGDSGDPTMQQAEEIVDQLAERLGRFAVKTGQRLQKWTARAREEAEDIWAEAQHLRGNGQG